MKNEDAMTITHAPFSDKQLQLKIEELRGKKHLPEQLVLIAAKISELQHEALRKIDREKLKDNLAAKICLAAPQGAGPGNGSKGSNGNSVDKRPGGQSILPGKEFVLDMPLTTELAKDILAVLAENIPELHVCAAELLAKLDEAGEPDEQGWLAAAGREVLNSDAAPILAAWAKEHPEAPQFLRFIVTSAAMPSLVAAGQILGKEHNSEKVWPHGYCPVCGSLPLIGRLVDKEGRRLHSCSLCGFEYRVPRLDCPFCLAAETAGPQDRVSDHVSKDHVSEYHVSEAEPGYLLCVCKTCRNYFKLSDLRELDRTWLPLLDDLSSLTLDIYAARHGYKRPTRSGWGF